MILTSQKIVFLKVGLGFNPNNKQKFLKNFFTSSYSNATINITYFYYGRVRHKTYLCNFRKLNGRLVRKVQGPKKILVINPKGSKKASIPKMLFDYFVEVSCSLWIEKKMISR